MALVFKPENKIEQVKVIKTRRNRGVDWGQAEQRLGEGMGVESRGETSIEI